jgi:predicted RNA-binding protein Jag
MQYIIEHEGAMGLFKGIGPQILKGLLVQGFLMMSKERIELSFIILFRYFRQVRAEKLQKLANMAAERAGRAAPILVK